MPTQGEGLSPPPHQSVETAGAALNAAPGRAGTSCPQGAVIQPTFYSPTAVAAACYDRPLLSDSGSRTWADDSGIVTAFTPWAGALPSLRRCRALLAATWHSCLLGLGRSPAPRPARGRRPAAGIRARQGSRVSLEGARRGETGAGVVGMPTVVCCPHARQSFTSVPGPHD